MLISGCGGCRNESALDDKGANAQQTDEEETADGKKTRDPYTVSPMVIYPGEFSDEFRRNYFKQGHIGTASVRLTANKSDTNGQLTSFGAESNGAPLPLANSSKYLASTRPVTLVRDEERLVEWSVMVPHREGIFPNLTVRGQLLAPSGLPYFDVSQPVMAMKPWQYHMVVLSDQPDQLRYIRMMDCIGIPVFDGETVPPFYVVVPVRAGNPVPLAESMMGWTTTAYLIWDNFDPSLLSEQQKQGMLDWLHFGGQLIINGPGSLELLQNSFLSPFLPAKQIRSINYHSSAFDALNQNWAVPLSNRGTGTDQRPLRLEIPENSPLLGIEMELLEGGREVDGTGGMVVENRVGRGRVAVTAFSLKDARLKRWGSMPSFFNGALLRKPGRQFKRTAGDVVSFQWNAVAETFNREIGSSVRFVCRDLNESQAPSSSLNIEEDDPVAAPYRSRFFNAPQMIRGADLYNIDFDESASARFPRWGHLFGGWNGLSDSGLGGWNDTDGIATAARRAITRSAGIRPPSRMFVIKMLAWYLLLLVPLNWLFFRLIGRVEWAWVAAPVIAVAGAITVVRMASLDIGFARSQSVVGLLELNGNHARGCLSEYSAVYTSLSTRYDVQFPDNEGIAVPFGSGREDPVEPVVLETTAKNRLKGFPVQSNRTGMLHVETMVDLEGPLSLSGNDVEGWTIENNTPLNLEETGLLVHDTDKKYRAAWVGSLGAGESRPVVFIEVNESGLYKSWENSPRFTSLDVIADRLWKDCQPDSRTETLAIDTVVGMPCFSDNDRDIVRDYLVRILRSQYARNEDVSNKWMINKQQFLTTLELFGEVDRASQSGLGEMFEFVRQKLELVPGEIRLIAATDQEVGKHVLKPSATQVRRQTLVLASLSPPALPAACRDDNTLLGFLAKTDQDKWLREIEGITDETEEETDPETRSEVLGDGS